MNPKNYIEQLIHELCPSGVPHKTLGEVCHLKRGRGLSKNDIVPTSAGTLPIILYGELYTEYSGHIKEIKSSAVKEKAILGTDARISDLLLPISSTTKEAQIGCAADLLIDKTIYVGGDAIVLSHDQNPGYLVYYINSARFEKEKMACVSGTTIRHLSPTKLMQISIPLPPLPIQEEIVRILDTFTQLITNIDTEIKEQQKLFTKLLNSFYDTNTQRVPIAALGNIIRGRRFIRTDIVEQGIPCIHYGDIYTKYSICVNKALTYLIGDITKRMRYAQNGDVVYVGAGENDEDIGIAIAWLGKEPVAVHDACYILSKHEQNAKYLAYVSRANNFHRQLRMSVAMGKICSIPPDGLGRVKIPLPSLAEQNRIVKQLETIEALITNLKTERGLRQMQYEYYREKLINLLK